MNKKRNWIAAIIVAATAGVMTLQNVSAPASAEVTTKTLTATFTIEPTLTSTPTYEGCGYMWAYHDDPELSTTLNDAVQVLDLSASANVQLFGEDCVYADGHSTFGAMETDFYIRLPAKDLSTQEVFGNWIKHVMDLVIDLPDDEIQGHKGFVEFWFIKSDAEQIILRVEINDYLNSSMDDSGLELFQKFYTPGPPPITPLPITPTSTP